MWSIYIKTNICIMRKLFLVIICTICTPWLFAQTITFPGASPNFCPGAQTVLTASNPGPTNVRWEFSSTGNAPWSLLNAGSTTYAANVVGFYRILNVPQTVIYDTIQVAQHPVPTSSFTSSPSLQCGTTPVNFTNTSSGGATYSWNFGDPNSGANNTSTVMNPSHRFVGLPGNVTQTFTVTLTTTNANGCSATSTRTVTTTQLPDATLGGPGFVIYDNMKFFKICSNAVSDIFEFFNVSTTQSTNTNYQIIWGDGTPDYNSPTFPPPPFIISHTYPLGTTVMKYIVTGLNGCKDTTKYFIFLGNNPSIGLENPGNTSICAGSTLTFPITGTSSHPPGTTYTVTFNDGTPVLNLPFPAPASISHTFNNTSCGTTSSIYSNSFSATIQASNPCASSSANVVPIYVSQKSLPSFEITPNDTVCTTNNVLFTNTTGTNSDVINGACTPGKNVWQITPATGWTVVTGTLGNNFNSSNTNFWITGTNSLTINFNTPGNYAIKLITGNTTCLTDSITKNICVSAAPVAAFDVSAIEGCAPMTVNTTNNSPAAFCGENTYAWSVTYTPAPGCSPAVSNFIYLNGTNANSTNPQFQFLHPGTYTIGLITTTPGNTCSSTVVTRTILVKDKPNVTLAPFSAVCQGQSITPSATVSCFLTTSSTYEWSFPGGNPATSSLANPGAINYINPGNYIVTLAVTNDCGTTTVTQPLVVNTVPDLTLPANDTLCVGETAGPFAFTSSATGITFTWTNNNTSIGLAASGTGNIPAFVTTNTGATPLTAIINVTVSNGLCSTQQSFSIIVNPRPLAPAVSSPVEYCLNETAVALISTATAGNSLLWYTVAAGGTGSVTAPIPSTTALGTTNFYVSQVNSTTNCEGPRSLIAVIIKPVPVIALGTIVSPPTCGSSTGSISLIGLVAGTPYSVNYIRNGTPVTVVITANTAGIVIINGLNAATYSNIFVVLNGCTSLPVGPVNLADPTQPATPTITSNDPLCTGGTLNLSATSTTTGASFLWTGPNGFTSAVANPFISNVTLAASGTYLVTATLNGCVSVAASVAVVINPTPTGNVASNNGPICEAQNITLSGTTATVGTISYNWTGPNGFSSNLQNPVINGATLAATGTYTLIVTATTNGQACAAAPVTTNITIKPVPVISITATNNPINCASATGSIVLGVVQPTTLFTVNYTLNTAPQTASITSDAAGFLTLNNLPQGLYANIIATLNGCASNAVGPVTLADPNPPVTPNISSNSAICAGQTLNLTSSSVSPGVITYSWTGPNGFNSALQNPTLPNAGASNAGTYTVTVTINSCTSLPASTIVVINPLASLPVVSSPVSYCINTTAVALTATNNAGHTLNWYSVPTGGISLGAAPVPITTTAGTTAYYVSQTTPLGCEGARAQIDVIIRPNALASFVPVNTLKCAPFNITAAEVGLQQFPANNSIYNWYVNNAFIGSGTTFPGYTINVPDDSVTIKLVTISTFGCRNDSLERKFYTIKVPIPSFTISDSVGCGPLSVAITNTSAEINLYNYLWDFGNGQTSTLQQPGTILFATNPTYGDTVYTINLRVASICDTIIFSRQVRVKSPPKALFIPDRTTGCSPMRVLFTNTSAGLNNTYYWNLGDGTTFVTTGRDTFTHIFTTGVVNTFTVQLIAVNECGADTIRFPLVAAPNNIRLNYIVNGPDNFGCAPHTVAFINLSSGASTFQWNFGDGNSINTTDNIDTVYHTYANAGNYSISVTAVNSCTDTTATRFITVYPKPTAAFTSNAYTVCVGQPIQLSNQSTAANTYAWNFGDGNTSVLVNPTHTYNNPGLYNIRLIAFRNNPSGDVCIDTAFQQVLVRDTLPGLFSMSDSLSTCAPLTVTFVNRIRPSVTAVWDFGDGSFGNGDSVIHNYTLPGVYLVNLIVTVPGGCVYQSQDTVRVLGPSGSFVYDAGYNCSPDAVMFTVSASNANSYVWNFGDGNTLTTTTNIVFHTYTNPGNYVPSVILQNTAGCNFPIQGIDTIKVDKIDAGFIYAAQQNCGSTLLQFTDTTNAFSGINTINWDFGDGTNGTGSSLNHLYSASGLYTVTMIVNGISGCADTSIKQINIQVKSVPIATIIADAERCAFQNVVFSANVVSTDPVTIQQWRLSNGVTAVGPSFSYLFNVPGTYNLRFISGTDFGCFDTALHTIVIRPAPFINATNSLTLCVGNSAQLNVTGAANYQWIPSQGLSCTTCPNPIATPTITTPYVVTASNSFGCAAYDTVVVTVIQAMNLLVSPNDSICIGSSSNLLASGATTYNWTPSATLSSSTVANPVATPTITTSYRVVGFDGFNCFTDTAFVIVAVGKFPRVNLGPDLTLATGTIHPLKSTITNGPIAQWLWQPSTDLSCSSCPLPLATIKKDITYTVLVTTPYGCTATDTISFKTFCENSQVFIPNAFSPDGDGINDVLMVRGKGIASVKHFKVFNRWGDLVFERSNFPPNIASFGWNGRVRGVVGPPDVFVYTAEVICENGTSYVYKGNTSIIK